MQGSEKDHGKMREQVVRHMEKHKDEFAPFVEDDEGFDKYMKRMSKVGHLMAPVHVHCRLRTFALRNSIGFDLSIA